MKVLHDSYGSYRRLQATGSYLTDSLSQLFRNSMRHGTLGGQVLSGEKSFRAHPLWDSRGSRNQFVWLRGYSNYTSRDPKQLRADGQAQTCQQLVAFCASTRMNQNDAVVNLARVALLHVYCWRASRFSTAPELRLGKRARWRASARA